MCENKEETLRMGELNERCQQLEHQNREYLKEIEFYKLTPVSKVKLSFEQEIKDLEVQLADGKFFHVQR